MINEIEKEILNGDSTNVAYSENGAKMNITTGKNLLDLNFQVPQLRGTKAFDRKLDSKLLSAFSENPELFIRFLFYMRDVRGGLGERQTFRNAFNWLCTNNGNIAKKLIVLIPEYGRWDDVVYIALNAKSYDIQAEAVRVIVEQLKKDNETDNVSLLGKWLPSVNAGIASKKDANKLIKLINKVYSKNSNINAAYYRKTVASLRKKAKIVERDIAAKTYGNINYEHVPSVANTRYASLFLKYDERRRRKYLETLNKGEKKINACAVFPHDIYKMTSRYADSNKYETANAMWKALPDFVSGKQNVMVIRDGSGSMETKIPGSNTTALDVASALCLYFAERLSGEFKDTFITFSSQPELVKLPSNLKTLEEKHRFLDGYDDCSNTNLKATFDLILRTALNNHMKQEDLPETLLIVSDMEFDSATSNYGWGSENNPTVNQKLFNQIESEWTAAGYKIPKLVFWNVNSRTGVIPTTQNELGVILVSGYSATIAKMVLSNELDPYKALVEQLMNERYDMVIEPIRNEL